MKTKTKGGYYSSFVVYGLGVLSIILFDILYPSYAGSRDVAYWAEVKSFMMIGATFATLGLNSLIVRHPDRKERYMSFFRTIGLFLLSVAGVIGWWGGSYFYYLLPVLFAFNMIVISYYRSQSKLFTAQVFQSFWKVVLVFSLAIGVTFHLEINIVAVCFFSLVVSSIYPIMKISKGRGSLDVEETSLSLKFFLSSFLVSCSVYLEVYLATKLFPHELSANYFTHFSLFSVLAMFFSGFVGFVLTPSIRANKARYERVFFSGFKMFALLVVVSLVGLVQLLFGGMFFDVFYPQYQINTMLAIVISVTVVIRVMYVFPTSYIGALSEKDDFNVFLVVGTVSVVCLYFYYKFYYLLTGDLVVSLALASMTNWLIRLLFAYSSAVRIFRKRKWI